MHDTPNKGLFKDEYRFDSVKSKKCWVI